MGELYTLWGIQSNIFPLLTCRIIRPLKIGFRVEDSRAYLCCNPVKAEERLIEKKVAPLDSFPPKDIKAIEKLMEENGIDLIVSKDFINDNPLEGNKFYFEEPIILTPLHKTKDERIEYIREPVNEVLKPMVEDNLLKEKIKLMQAEEGLRIKLPRGFSHPCIKGKEEIKSIAVAIKESGRRALECLLEDSGFYLLLGDREIKKGRKMLEGVLDPNDAGTFINAAMLIFNYCRDLVTSSDLFTLGEEISSVVNTFFLLNDKSVYIPSKLFTVYLELERHIQKERGKATILFIAKDVFECLSSLPGDVDSEYEANIDLAELRIRLNRYHPYNICYLQDVTIKIKCIESYVKVASLRMTRRALEKTSIFDDNELSMIFDS